MGKGIIVYSVYMIRRMSKYLYLEKKRGEKFLWFNVRYFDKFYWEIQSHPNEYHMQLNNDILKFTEGIGTDDIVITTDAYMITKD